MGATLRVCAEPGCPAVSDGTRCPTHTRQYVRFKNRFASGLTAYNTVRWQRLRDQVRREEPFCVHRHLGLPHCTLVTDIIDHKVPHRGDPVLFFDRQNLQGMCGPCHARKTAAETGQALTR